ncbi:hypothetical protein PVAP13_7NG401301 [Panicum virgatum]|uniref:Uncharacterized protein n=1 Tax=Panicum virgatum TaxID=38727 RepID=A0A8T0Q3D4_PANVG|nr:hypothetical protein PVAP13_7NG401301 [Panicum virgatum]
MFLVGMILFRLCLQIVVVIPVYFNSSPWSLFINAASLFLSWSPWISTLCCVASLLQDLRTLLTHWRCFHLHPWVGARRHWSSSTGFSSSSNLRAGFPALAPSIIMGPFGCHCASGSLRWRASSQC